MGLSLLQLKYSAACQHSCWRQGPVLQSDSTARPCRLMIHSLVLNLNIEPRVFGGLVRPPSKPVTLSYSITEHQIGSGLLHTGIFGDIVPIWHL